MERVEGYPVAETLRKSEDVHEYLAQREGETFRVVQYVVDASERASLQAQAMQLEGISHPSLPDFLGVVELDDGIAYIYEAPTGESGTERIERFVEMAPVDRYRFLQDVMGALGALHSEGFVHGRLAPEHVYWTGERWMLAPPDIRPDRMPPGVPDYRAWEQDFEPVPATDQYGAATTLVHLIGHVAPSDYVLNDRGLDLGKLPVNDPFRQVLYRMISSRPDRRFASADEAYRAGTRALTRSSWEAHLEPFRDESNILSARVDDGRLRVQIRSREASGIKGAVVWIGLVAITIAALAGVIASGLGWKGAFWVLVAWPLLLFRLLPTQRRRQIPATIEVGPDGWRVETQGLLGKTIEIGDTQPPDVMVNSSRGQRGSEQDAELILSDMALKKVVVGHGLREEDLVATANLIRSFDPDEQVLDPAEVDEEVVLGLSEHEEMVELLERRAEAESTVNSGG